MTIKAQDVNYIFVLFFDPIFYLNDEIVVWIQISWYIGYHLLKVANCHTEVEKKQAKYLNQSQDRKWEVVKCCLFRSSYIPKIGILRSCCPKEKGKIRVCMDFTDFNWVSPEKDFSLSYIDVLADYVTYIPS